MATSIEQFDCESVVYFTLHGHAVQKHSLYVLKYFLVHTTPHKCVSATTSHSLLIYYVGFLFNLIMTNMSL